MEHCEGTVLGFVILWAVFSFASGDGFHPSILICQRYWLQTMTAFTLRGL